MWIAAAEQAVKIILDSQENNFIKKDDVMKVAKFVEEIRGSSVITPPLRVGFFRASQQMEEFSWPGNIYKL
jgi:hypothetical protein